MLGFDFFIKFYFIDSLIEFNLLFIIFYIFVLINSRGDGWSLIWKAQKKVSMKEL